MQKRLVFLASMLLALVLALPARADTPAPSVTLDGQTVTYDFARAPHIHEGEVYIAAKALLDAMGRTWSYDAEKKVLTVGGQPVTWDYNKFRGPHEHDGALFVPVRPVVEAAGATFMYHGDTGEAMVLGAVPKVKVLVNGKQVSYDFARAPHIHENHVYIAGEALAQALGTTFAWDEATTTVSLGGKAITWDYKAHRAAHIHDGHAFVAVRAAAESLGYTIKWNALTWSVELSK